MSAKELERELGISYRAAWLMLQKLRRAMVRPGRDRDKLSGEIEVDESFLGGPVPGGKRGRGAEGKVIVAIAVERKGLGKKSKRCPVCDRRCARREAPPPATEAHGREERYVIARRWLA